MSDVTVPDWIIVLVGRLTLENEGLRVALAQAERAATNGHVPTMELVEGHMKNRK